MIGLDFRITFRIAVEKNYLSSLKGVWKRLGWCEKGVLNVFMVS